MGKTVIIIAGPTAVGKTSVALKIASHFSTSIISADSRQCFRELNIGVAKPSMKQLNQVPHYFINSHSIHDNVNAGTFEQYALQAANEIFSSNDIAVMAGGTGLYIKAFTEGMDHIPEVPAAVRKQIANGYLKNGIEWLQSEIKKLDPENVQYEIKNPQRLMRALEVLMFTGKPIKAYQHNIPVKRPFTVFKIAIGLEKQQLHANINHRTNKMIEAGLVEEARSLLQHRHLNALKTVGYTEIFEFLDGKATLLQAVEQINTNTRAYAKRQMTWFKKDREFDWYEPEQVEEIIENTKLKIRNAKF